MLISIYIENIALIKKLSLEPDYGFCAFTGETGAGKSIIIDSLGLLCGARSDKDIIRTGEEEACVEGIFSLNEQAVKFLAEYDIEPEEDGAVTVLRKLSRDGRSVAKVNGRSIPLSRLKAVMSQLISIHGQQDTQAFADNGRQLQMLDSFAKNEALLTAYSEKYNKFKAIEQKLDSLNEDERERELRLDMLKYRVNELRSADVKVGEKEELEAERLRLANSERIVSNASEAYVTLYARDGSAIESVDNAINATSSLLGIIPEADELVSRLESAKYELIDIADTVKSYTDTDGENVQMRLDDVEARLELIKKLERKYRVNADEFQDLLSDWLAELEASENTEEEKERLTKELSVAKKELKASALTLSDSRKKAAELLCSRVTDELNELDMPGVTFTVDLKETEFSENGNDFAEFLISANKGEIPKPMSKIASGGELSRIMLCLKCVFADTESIGTLIFDEIDAGVSGRTSEKIGIRLKNATDGKKTQIICVTHSAILASRADAHYKISKKETDGRVITNVEKLDRTGRRDELARIMGGVNITETVLKAAEEMLDK